MDFVDSRRGAVGLLCGVLLGFTPACALSDPGDDATGDASESLTADGEDIASQAVCSTGTFKCHAHVQTMGRGSRVTSDALTPVGFGANELAAAYKISNSYVGSTRPTVAIIDAYGYPNLESDLKTYRAQYGLPACTTADGCLRIVNQDGAASPLPSAPPARDDWTLETALDLDMASAGCPQCKLLVVQANDPNGDGLLIAQNTAAMLGATVISDSWGGPEQSAQSTAQAEPYFDHPGIGIFVSAGDAGFNDEYATTGTGPDYPGTSAHTIAVGATRLVRDASARGWRETTWAPGANPSMTGAGGSACSLSVAKPAYQTASPCQFKASADIAAVGDPATGVAVYDSSASTNPGWSQIGGSSAAAPLVAAIFANTGNGSQNSGAFMAAHTSALYDVTSGTNGTCGSQTLLCNAATGWDGPTGFGTPNGSLLAGLSVDPHADETSDGGGCAVGGSGSGGSILLLGLALLGLQRRRR